MDVFAKNHRSRQSIDWAGIPNDVLELILEKIESLIDYLQFGAYHSINRVFKRLGDNVLFPNEFEERVDNGREDDPFRIVIEPENVHCFNVYFKALLTNDPLENPNDECILVRYLVELCGHIVMVERYLHYDEVNLKGRTTSFVRIWRYGYL
ncbi:hypothetical protein F8388_025386 [Cannabis sativa]|uniref:F-box domain-containing protein n=1 Tax=Cannabis sativa TaxID=3483 RepID=A0A7J6G0L3_CANSA|nr:hypothetical protein F8388_025386 [Cannabis sativa]